MIPSRQSPAYGLFARRPIAAQPPDVLAADPPARQEPLPPSSTEDTADCPLRAPAGAALAPTVVQPRPKGAAADSQSVPVAQSSLQGGCGPQILSAFVKQRTYQPVAEEQDQLPWEIVVTGK